MEKNAMTMLLAIACAVAVTACSGQTPAVHMRRLINYRTPSDPKGPAPVEIAATNDFAWFGYVFGTQYRQEEKMDTVMRSGAVEKYMPRRPIPGGFHGISTVSCELTPTGKKLYSMRLARSGFSGRADLLNEGRAVVDDLGRSLGCRLAPFKYVNLDTVSRGLADPFVSDESLWATSRNVLAVSHTRIGTVSLKVTLRDAHFTHLALSVLIKDDKVAEEGRREFETEVLRRKDETEERHSK